jgi:plasmid stabilization system protein ParE
MRRIVRSRTSFEQLQRLLEFGAMKFGARVTAEKLMALDWTVETHLAEFPGTGKTEMSNQLYSYAVSRTPFVVLYDFDDLELRVHFIVHARSDRSRIDPSDVVW